MGGMGYREGELAASDGTSKRRRFSSCCWVGLYSLLLGRMAFTKCRYGWAGDDHHDLILLYGSIDGMSSCIALGETDALILLMKTLRGRPTS